MKTTVKRILLPLAAILAASFLLAGCMGIGSAVVGRAVAEAATATPEPSEAPTPEPTPEPTPKPTPTARPDPTHEPEATPETEHDYVLNTNTMKFHKPTCASVGDIKAGNREDYTGTRSSVIDMGYEPCGRCNP